ncbi:hypothetical protein [Staphylococcus succinus]|uniref:hypothetical protein n=1 Tax=Staphylococcus succinus TaxID=61015 RepID=UPI00062BD331|nr:hypothetical protein [Staphylococcus succinus]MDH9162087.1 hypothetical protein [Staphylococcus succinus]PNZ17364.1 hypothetical protein CD109_10915 [Staphylococcus succinus subsp. succinus]RIN43289.1 hypothetical protein BU059_06335 [Staphylococcus succinus]
MVYKYEQKINEAFFRANRAGGNVNNELLAELQEVYRKAKAWDKYIAEVRERVRFTENTEVDIEHETQKVIDYYTEDE